MEITSPILYANLHQDVGASAAIQGIPVDFSVRAPFGVMMNRVDVFITINGIATIQGLLVVAGLQRDPDLPAALNELLGATNDPAASFQNLNSDVVVYGAMGTYATTATPDVTVRVPQVLNNKVQTADFYGVPPEARPVSVRPWLAFSEMRLEAGISAQTYNFALSMQYQTVRLDDNELVGLVASR